MFNKGVSDQSFLQRSAVHLKKKGHARNVLVYIAAN